MPRLLIIEDDALVRHGMLRLLNANGHDARGAPDAQSGLAEARARTPDLVVLDIGLPDMSGIDCARLLRRDLPRCPILFLTAREGDEAVREAIAVGAHAYLVKPVTAAQLLPMVMTVLRASQEAEKERHKLLVALQDSREISAAAGILAERHGWSTDEAFEVLRTLARSREKKITEVAAEVIAEAHTPPPNANSSPP